MRTTAKKPAKAKSDNYRGFVAAADVDKIIEQHVMQHGSTISWVCNTAIRFWDANRENAEGKAA
jgi:hypothetical protein